MNQGSALFSQVQGNGSVFPNSTKEGYSVCTALLMIVFDLSHYAALEVPPCTLSPPSSSTKSVKRSNTGAFLQALLLTLVSLAFSGLLSFC
ncbi:hypothetical protein QOT17_009352 [Balamuthia mandrillaris]